jgi:hypothetical protein
MSGFCWLALRTLLLSSAATFRSSNGSLDNEPKPLFVGPTHHSGQVAINTAAQKICGAPGGDVSFKSGLYVPRLEIGSGAAGGEMIHRRVRHRTQNIVNSDLRLEYLWTTSTRADHHACPPLPQYWRLSDPCRTSCPWHPADRLNSMPVQAPERAPGRAPGRAHPASLLHPVGCLALHFHCVGCRLAHHLQFRALP